MPALSPAELAGTRELFARVAPETRPAWAAGGGRARPLGASRRFGVVFSPFWCRQPPYADLRTRTCGAVLVMYPVSNTGPDF